MANSRINNPQLLYLTNNNNNHWESPAPIAEFQKWIYQESSAAVSQAPESYDASSRSNSNNSQFSYPNQRRPLIRTQTSSHGRHHHANNNTQTNNNSNNNSNHSQSNNINFNTLNSSNNNNNKQPNDTQYSSDSNSSGSRSDSRSSRLSIRASNPVWHYKSIFDVVGAKSELEVSIYDSGSTEEADHFLGHIKFTPQTIEESRSEMWYRLKPRVNSELITGKIKLKLEYSNTRKRHYGPDDFEILKMLGKGTFGRVFQVRKKDTDRVYAMKVLSKKLIWNKKEVAHTLGERNILARSTDSPFIVGLKFSFQTLTDLYLVTDYMSGGEMFFQLQKAGRFPEPRAKFYIAELILALEHLHDNDVVYRDLKPENILLDVNGHIALCDFGLSKADLKPKDTTNTFCGTTEYLAPEVLLDETGYTKMVDFWSLGVLIFEMCCGWSPFFAESTQQMYKNIAFGKVRFPKEILSPEGRSFVKGLLNRNPLHRLGSVNGARELQQHPFFNDIDWDLLRQKKIPPPMKPHLENELDTSNFDPEFTNTSTAAINKELNMLGTTPLSQAVQANFQGFSYVDDSTMFDYCSSYRPTGLGAGKYGKTPVFGGASLGASYGGSLGMGGVEEAIDEDSEEDEDVRMGGAGDQDRGVDEDGVDRMDVDEDVGFVNGQFDL
ncbi:unnamed protein product [Ambrosiozyma monospora]|uniref:Unnamed protein product n=1 Tax=Ambrosiozyma monospora TaxID=43982 RepID=A0ACB5SX44_AMBMO|nr:unnamed protein product [Ambrosiozyma monospora]